jgi:hypothetical protein
MRKEIKMKKQRLEKLESIRKSIEAENVSYGELAELQRLKDYIKPDDVLLLQWAGVEEEI